MRIAIVRLSAVGDIIQSMVVLQFIKQRVANVSIDWIVDSKFADLLDQCKDIDKIIKLDIEQIKKKKSIVQLFDTLKKLQKLEKYDQVYDLQGLIKSAIITRFIPSEERIGFDRQSIREKLASYFYSKKYHFPYHENVISRYVGLVGSSLKISITEEDIFNKKPFFNLTSSKTNSDKPTIVIILGASFRSKIYPVDQYSVIAKTLSANFIAIWHTKDELKMAQKLHSLANNVSLVKCENFYALKKVILNSDIVIGGDTGPTHLAWSLNKPSITIFGSTPSKRNCFITEKNLAISSCSNINPYKINKHDSSINKISPENIIALITKLL